MNAHPNPDTPAPADPALSRTLRTWQVDGTLPPDFVPEVHRRIAAQTRKPASPARGTTPFAGLLGLIAMLQRPAFAATYVAAGILLGAISGSRYAQTSPQSSPDDLQLRYLASIDPYRMPRTTPPSAHLP